MYRGWRQFKGEMEGRSLVNSVLAPDVGRGARGRRVDRARHDGEGVSGPSNKGAAPTWLTRTPKRRPVSGMPVVFCS